jgi:RNA polymerase sporulation-specific sigma factor
MSFPRIPVIEWTEVVLMFELFRQIFSQLLFFTLHLRQQSSFPPPLPAAKERALLQQLRATGDKQARALLIEHNLRLVAHIIKKYYAAGGDQDDLVSIGTIGLIKAIDSFDPDKGTRLATYAARCIENEILMHFRALRRTAGTVSLTEPMEADKDGSPLSLMDLISVDDTIADDLDLKQKSRQLYAYLSEMEDPREKEILIKRYGLYQTREMTQREIAKELGISRSYVSRIEKKAIGRLRERFSLPQRDEKT